MYHKIKIFLLFITLSLLACRENVQVDLIVRNGTIYTVNDMFEVVQAMAIKDGKIVAIGPENEILNKYYAIEVIDAEKKAIYPGFIDAHCHFVGYAKNLLEVNLIGSNSFEEVIERLREFVAKNETPKGSWIIGRGWNENFWQDKKMPTKEKLDELFPDNPVFLSRVDGHAALVNQKAMDLTGITTNTKIEGGRIEAINGKLTGLLIDNAKMHVQNQLPEYTNAQIAKALLTAEKHLFEVGLTTVDDAGLEQYDIELIDELQQANKLHIKVYAMVSATPELLDYYLEKGTYKTSKLNVASFKFYADGSLGSESACLLDDYHTTKHNKGLILHELEFYEKYAPLLAEKGFQMNTHAIGDSATRMMLKVYEQALTTTNDKRWRIEHAQVVHPEDLEKFRKLTIIPSVQPTHAMSDMEWAVGKLGDDRMKTAYAYKDLLNQLGMIALGTDFPVEDINPLYTFYSATIRKNLEGKPEQGLMMENALSREEALKGITIWAAIANFEEEEKGSLEVGKSADFIITNRDIMKVDEQELLKTKVEKTFIDGKMVFEN
ncbi:MAG: amidohydrolase [Vicingaceae bacterium]|nr:amidohydrolase [Vicingaceae bacterium]